MTGPAQDSATQANARTSVRIADELRTALHHAGIIGPYNSSGDAFGADNVRTFAERYMRKSPGWSWSTAMPASLNRRNVGKGASWDKGIIAQLRDCRNAIAEHKPLPLLTGRGANKPQRTCAQQFFRGIPEAEWSPELNAKLLEIAQDQSRYVRRLYSEMEQTPDDEAYLRRHRRSFGSRPIRVVTSGNHGVGHLERKPPDTPEHLKI